MSSVCEIPPDPNNNNTKKCYSLRPRGCTRRGTDDEEEVTWLRRRRRPKGKPEPLSKHRRKTANARERSRMKEINEAFESLRRAVPVPRESEKLTKISTLRLAMRYISALSQILNEPESDAESLLSDTLTESSLTPPLTLDPFAYSDLGDSSVSLDPYTDLTLVLDEAFPPDFS